MSDECCKPKSAPLLRGPAGPPGPAGPVSTIKSGYPTTISGLLKGLAGTLQQAVAGEDYATPSQITISYLPGVTSLQGGLASNLDSLNVGASDVGTVALFRMSSDNDEIHAYHLVSSAAIPVPPTSIAPINGNDVRWLKVNFYDRDRLDNSVEFMPSVTGLAAGGPSDLEAVAFTEDDAGLTVGVFNSDGDGKLYFYQVKLGSNPTSLPDYIRPLNYDGVTNAITLEFMPVATA